MANNGIVCPKCGYNGDSSGSVSDTECLRCGIVYAKYIAQPGPPVDDGNAGPQYESSLSRSGYSPSLSFLVTVAFLLLILGLVSWKAMHGPSHPMAATDKAESIATPEAVRKVAAAFPYSIRGSFKSRFVCEYPQIPFNAEFEAGVTVSEEYRIEQLSWTDYHLPGTLGKMDWSFPFHAETSWDETQGEAPEKLSGLSTRVLSLQREGHALQLNYSRPTHGEIAIDIKDAFEQPFSSQGASGAFEYVKERDLLKARVKFILVPKGVIDVPREAITTFNGSVFWGKNRCVGPYLIAGKKLPGDVETKAGSFIRGLDSGPIEIFARGNTGIGATFTLKNVDVSTDVLGTGRPASAIDFNAVRPDIIRLNQNSKFLLDFGGLEREAEILFYRDGRKQLSIKNRKANPDRPLIFDLEPL